MLQFRAGSSMKNRNPLFKAHEQHAFHSRYDISEPYGCFFSILTCVLTGELPHGVLLCSG
jgi:hypothetical protein